MRAWRLVGRVHEATAFTGHGAAAAGGRWNSIGTGVVYTADSLALATLELVVHLEGFVVETTALEVDVPDRLIERIPLDDLPVGWQGMPAVTAFIGDEWVRTDGSLALIVPSVLVDERSGERNVLINPRHPSIAEVTEVQRLEVVLDERF